jgi:hypothetical protein
MGRHHAVGSFVHSQMVTGWPAAGFDPAQQCYTPAMYGKVKRLRNRGARLSDREISQSQAVEGAIKVYGLGTSIVATVTDPASQVGDPLLPMLYEAKLTTMHSNGMLLKGEERPQGDTGPAYVQEWSVRFGE